MTVAIEGTIRTRYYKGFGPFEKAYMESAPFTCRLDVKSGRVTPSEDVVFWLERTTTGWALRGLINGIPCVYGEFRDADPTHIVHFMMLSTGDIEVMGQAAVVPVGSAYLA